MSAIFQKIEVGQDFTDEGISEAIDRNFQTILRSDMSRFAYARATLRFDSVRELPFAHVMNHRVRLPRLLFDFDANDDAITDVVMERLRRMLCVSSHLGASELVANALRLEPARDAHALVQIQRDSRRLFDLMLRGRIGSAIALAKKLNFPGVGAEGFRDLAANLLCYHTSHQVQMIIARANALDQFAYKLEATQREYTTGGACKNVSDILALIEAATRSVVNETNQPSQNLVIKNLEPRAEEIRAKIRQTDDELLSEIGVFLQDNRHLLNRLREDVQPQCGKLKSSLHKTVFGLTAFETLIFAASRLVQLNLNASRVIEAEISGRSNRFNFTGKDLPPRENKAVSKVVFSFRSTILRDKTFIDSIPDRGLGDLTTEWTNRSDGDFYAYEAIKKTRKLFRGIKRDVLSFPVSGQLDAHQRVDILPEFLLQERVDAVPPGKKLLTSAKKAHDQNQSHRPHNVRRASGKR